MSRSSMHSFCISVDPGNLGARNVSKQNKKGNKNKRLISKVRGKELRMK